MITPLDRLTKHALKWPPGAEVVARKGAGVHFRFHSAYQGVRHVVHCDFMRTANAARAVVSFPKYTFASARKAEMDQRVADLMATHRSKTDCVGGLDVVQHKEACFVRLALVCPDAERICSREDLSLQFVGWVVRESDCIFPVVEMWHKGYATTSALIFHAYGPLDQLCRA